MHTSPEHDDDLSHANCGCGYCDPQIEVGYDDEDVYDDPYEVVMYDIDTESDNLYGLFDMLADPDRTWYAKRRLNALAAAGPLSALVADIIIDSLGRKWDPLLHPRDRFGRFINTGGFLRWLSGGKWLRGQVSRIDSDGNIHVRSAGNDGVDDGEIFRFKPELSNKLVSTKSPVADLDGVDTDVDVDADVPDFPEASPAQKRIWNTLADGDMPAEDLDRSLRDLDLSVDDFTGEVQGLEDRGLIEIDRSGVKPRVRRNDDNVKAVVDVDDIDEIPDDETPDLEDSPTLTKAQRDLLDAVVELDRGEGDGVGIDEIPDASDEDLQALVDAGALVPGDGGVYHLENPESGAAPDAAAPVEPDLTTEIFDAAAEALDDPDAQEAFQHYAEELARPGDANNAPLPEDLSPAKRRNAEALANAWWEERNAPAPSTETTDVPEAEVDAPEVEQPDPQGALNPRNQALADQLVAEYFPDDEFLDSTDGIEYRNAVKRMFDAADYNEAGFAEQADSELDKAERALRRVGAPDEDITGWPVEVENVRNAEREAAAPDVPADEAIEDVVPEDVPEVERQAPVELMDRPSAKLYLRDHPRAQELLDEDATEYQWGYEAAQLDAAEGLSPLTDEESDSLWGLDSGYNEGYLDASMDQIGAGDDTTGADEIQEDVVPDEPAEDAAPEADVPEDAPEADVPEDVVAEEPVEDVVPEGAPEDVPEAVDDTPVEEPVADEARVLTDEERDLLNRIDNGGQAKRSERDLEDALIEEGLLEEDENGDSRLSDAGRAAFGEDDSPDAVAEDVVEEPDVIPDPDVVDDATEEDIAPVPDTDSNVEPADDAIPAQTTNAQPGPILPDPADPNDATPGFRWVGRQNGLNAGGFYEVTDDNGPLKAGDTVYIKNGRSPEHAQNEVLANRLYALSGVSVPEVVLGSSGDRLVSKIIDDVKPLNTHDPSQQEAVDKIRDEFAIDAWIANWDGMMSGNTLISPDGTPYRIDVGSAMEFRAQGGLKGAAFGDTIEELTNLRNPAVNYEAGIVFGPMTDDQVKKSIERLAAIDPVDIRTTIIASDLPDKDALADKMVTRRANALAHYGIADPHAPGSTNATPGDDSDADVAAPDAMPAPTQAAAKAAKAKSAVSRKRLSDFQSRSNPHLEVRYDSNGILIMADGSPLDTSQYYHKAKGGEGKHGRVIEVLDQERYPGLVKMEYLDGTQQIRHVLGVNSGKGGLVPSSQDDVDAWERQARVVGDKAEDLIDPADFPMSDGATPVPGAQIVFEVGGEEQYGVLLYFDPKYDAGGRAFIIPEGGGKVMTRPVRLIRSQTQEELDSDATPLVPYDNGAVVAQYLPPPRFDANGDLLSRENKPVRLGDWMVQRRGGDSLVGEVIDIPDQNLYPGWVTLRFPDGEVRARHVEGFTGVNQSRGAGGLRHTTAPDPDTWARVRRVKGEEGDVLSYDFSNLETSDGTTIEVGKPAFGKGRNGQDVSGLLIRINPHTKRNGEVVPTGFVWQNGREVPVDVNKITNTRPPVAPTPTAPRPPSTRTTARPSPARVVTPQPSRRPSAPSRPSRTNPPVNNDNPAPAYTAGSVGELSDEAIEALDTNPRRLYTSRRTNGVHSTLAAIYEAQDFDTLPQVVDQAEYARLERDEGYVPIVRSMYSGTDATSGLRYEDAFKYGPYYAGDGVYGNGSYFAYGRNALQESSGYGQSRIYALVRPGDLRSVDYEPLSEQYSDEIRALRAELTQLERGSDEYNALDKKYRLYSSGLGEYAAAKGYDAIIVRGGNSHWGTGARTSDIDLASEGYIVILNRGATIVADEPFPDRPDIFQNGFPEGLADSATLTPAVEDVPVDGEAPADAGTGLADAAAPGVV